MIAELLWPYGFRFYLSFLYIGFLVRVRARARMVNNNKDHSRDFFVVFLKSLGFELVIMISSILISSFFSSKIQSSSSFFNSIFVAVNSINVLCKLTDIFKSHSYGFGHCSILMIKKCGRMITHRKSVDGFTLGG